LLIGVGMVALLGDPWPTPAGRLSTPSAHGAATDDWPDPVPVTEAEIEVFE
jgi:hypothetical protein